MHVIRLRRPWRKLGPDGIELRVDVPEHPYESLSPSSAPLGQATLYERSFNSPSGIDADTKVLLRIESWEGRLTTVTVNDQIIATNVERPGIDIDVLPVLRPNNRLIITLESANESEPRLSGGVSLLISAEPS
ncbi:hypothetical protein Poly51_22750 [Rubripirellula tenax]|uniref:Glycosyl hydrolases family 2, sugar binding domain n=1 Tax=Rubripirellula tenax TaxID=2528015 RepID=A0A5C6FFH0_9BACT|nr:hypothetical protein [Rubripirellula tenax]TWU59487.1 hypothetical protein Poly51_22750 [Rubripirellula tenax]